VTSLPASAGLLVNSSSVGCVTVRCRTPWGSDTTRRDQTSSGSLQQQM